MTGLRVVDRPRRRRVPNTEAFISGRPANTDKARQEGDPIKARPNRTLVRAIFRSFKPSADGRGGEVELEILRNDSSPDEDFIRPEPRKLLRAYSPDPPSLRPGCKVVVRLTFLGGPTGGRNVVQDMRPAKR